MDVLGLVAALVALSVLLKVHGKAYRRSQHPHGLRESRRQREAGWIE